MGHAVRLAARGEQAMEAKEAVVVVGSRTLKRFWAPTGSVQAGSTTLAPEAVEGTSHCLRRKGAQGASHQQVAAVAA